jgi:hypothetical protein
MVFKCSFLLLYLTQRDAKHNQDIRKSELYLIQKNRPTLDIKMDKLWSLMRASAVTKTDSAAMVRRPWTNAS